MDDVGLSINVFVGLFALDAVLRGLRAFSQGHGVYFCLVLLVLLTVLNVLVDILSKEEICHFLVDFRSCGRDRYQDVLLTLYCNPDVLWIGALLPSITRQGLGGCGKLIRLGSRSHIIDVTLEVLC